MTVFSLLSWLNLVGGVVTLLLGFIVWNWAVLVLALVTLAHCAAWDQVDKLSDEFERLKTYCGMREE